MGNLEGPETLVWVMTSSLGMEPRLGRCSKVERVRLTAKENDLVTQSDSAPFGKAPMTHLRLPRGSA